MNNLRPGTSVFPPASACYISPKSMQEFYPLDYLSPLSLAYWRHTLWRSQYYGRQPMRDLQWRLFSRMIHHCQEKVPYYRELFGHRGPDIKRLEDLVWLPILDKETVRDRHEEFKATDFRRYRPRMLYTTGTTGSPLTVYWDAPSNLLELTCHWRHFSWLGYRLGQTLLDVRSQVTESPEGYRWHRSCRILEISTDYIDATNLEWWADLIRRSGATLWRGHPFAMWYLCGLLKEAGIEDVRPRHVAPCSEALLPLQREFLESFTGGKVCDSYGQTEHSALIVQCPKGGYHICSEYGIVEIVGEDGLPARAGEEGRIVATGLHNRAFPLLRYDTGDLAVASDRNCSCGRTLPLVEEIRGREDDYLMDSRGRWVSGLRFALWNRPGVRFNPAHPVPPRKRRHLRRDHAGIHGGRGTGGNPGLQKEVG